MNTTQATEISTIRDRNLSIQLSDADIDRLCNKAGAAGLTVPELLQNFIGDLVDGTYSNGSDERMYANQWFDRCGFSMGYGETSFLQWLIANDIVDETILDWIELQEWKSETDLNELDLADMSALESDLNETFDEYKRLGYAVKDSSLDSEMEKVMQWHHQKSKLREVSAAAPNPQPVADLPILKSGNSTSTID